MGGGETGGWNFYKQLYRVEASSAVTCWPQNKIFIKNIFFLGNSSRFLFLFTKILEQYVVTLHGSIEKSLKQACVSTEYMYM